MKTKKTHSGQVSRRRFLHKGAVLVGGSVVGPSCLMTGCHNAENVLQAWQWMVLSEEEARLLDMICEQIIPADEDPGAHDAGVVCYIDRQLAKGGRLEEARDGYIHGLRKTEESSKKRFGSSFVDLSWEDQTRLLQSMEKDQLDKSIWDQQSASSFFGMCRAHTIEGFFGHPRHGGNRNLAGYRTLKFEYPELRGQNRYTDERFSKYL